MPYKEPECWELMPLILGENHILSLAKYLCMQCSMAETHYNTLCIAVRCTARPAL